MTTERLTGQEWRPNLFIAGFAKCGTTELCDYLSQHPDIFLPIEKEPNTFYDLAKYPAYFSGNRAGNLRYRRFLSLNETYEMFSKGKKYKYRIDGTPSYTFDPKFSGILKSFSENAKVILLIRDQKDRLASMYFFSLVRHKENDFARWTNDYFIPYITSYLYYDKIVAYYHQFGDSNLKIIETSNLSSEDVHKQIFEYLEIKPIKISVKHKNPNLLGPTDSKVYLQLILTLASIEHRTLGVARKIGLGNQSRRASVLISDLTRQLLKKQRHNNKKKKKSYSDIIKLIPDTVSSTLDEDYRNSIDFAIQKRILISPT
jgi:hypothetical protein